MKTILMCLALFLGQMNTLQDKPVVQLREQQGFIKVEFGGDLVELINAPKTIELPKSPPTPDSQGKSWSVDVKNLGPGTVTVVDKAQFSVQVSVGQTVHIKWNGSEYSSMR